MYANICGPVNASLSKLYAPSDYYLHELSPERVECLNCPFTSRDTFYHDITYLLNKPNPQRGVDVPKSHNAESPSYQATKTEVKTALTT